MTAADTTIAPGPSPTPTDPNRPPPRPARLGGVGTGTAAAFVAVIVAGVVLRFVVRSSLWLDEALSVHIAALPLDEIGAALRQDGHPPLYYLLLHAWIGVFGDGDVAARALAGVLAVAALPLMWSAGHRLGGRRVAMLSVVFLASSPFAIRYATETRMYSFVTLLALAGYLSVLRGLETPRIRRLAVVAVLTGALLLTHYWSFYAIAAGAVALLVSAWRDPLRRPPVRRVLAAMAIGCLGFLPWLDSFLYQAAHTGTPWGQRVQPASAALETVVDFGGGKWPGGRLLGPILIVLAISPVLARVAGRQVLGLAVGTLAIGVTAAIVTGSAYQSRYAAAVLPFVLLAAAVGTARLPNRTAQVVVVAIVVVAGFAGGIRTSVRPRTQAAEVATVLDAAARPGDVVAFCPDQLAVAVHRLLDVDVIEATYPDGSPAGRVNWVDYNERVRSADPSRFADDLIDTAGPDHRIWVVSGVNYRPFDRDCEAVLDALGSARPGGTELVARDTGAYERHTLTRFGAP